MSYKTTNDEGLRLRQPSQGKDQTVAIVTRRWHSRNTNQPQLRFRGKPYPNLN
jgi:hypothetical protein